MYVTFGDRDFEEMLENLSDRIDGPLPETTFTGKTG
jgi:hypothetical protein